MKLSRLFRRNSPPTPVPTVVTKLPIEAGQTTLMALMMAVQLPPLVRYNSHRLYKSEMW